MCISEGRHSSATGMQGTVVVTQPNYVPWRGHFALLAEARTFVVLDDVQYTKRDWRNRNTILGPNGLEWLSIPVRTKGHYTQSIKEVHINDLSWKRTHWARLKWAYGGCVGWEAFADLFGSFYSRPSRTFLVDELLISMQLCLEGIGVRPEVLLGSELPGSQNPSERLAVKVASVGGRRYVTGPSARNYLDNERFRARGIEVEWFRYPSFSPYSQHATEFVENVSVLDFFCQNARDKWKDWHR